MPSLRDEFMLGPGVVFLNHGSFGAWPRPVFERYQRWQRELETQPVEFLSRRIGGLLDEARERLALTVGADAASLAFVVNATTAVNLAARSIDLRPNDEVLATDLEYGACTFAWERVGAAAGARYVRAKIPLPLERPQQAADALFAQRSECTRAVFVSHLTSETALRLPVEAIVARAREEGLVTIVDGAHAPGHVPLDIDALGADFYAGNCHKWLCAPKGAGFLAVSEALSRRGRRADRQLGLRGRRLLPRTDREAGHARPERAALRPRSARLARGQQLGRRTRALP